MKNIKEMILNYRTINHQPKEIYDGITMKVRVIYIPTAEETIIQHAVVRVLDRYLSKGMYEHTYAAIKGRGQVKAKKKIKKWIRDNPKGVKYYLKMDIKKYFPSVPQKLLLEKLEKYIKDYRTIDLIRKILAVADDGIPLGYYISQWLANWYLMDLDRYIKEELKVKIYIRWMDDQVIFGSNKRKLHKIKDDIAAYLRTMGLTLKNNWKVELFSYGETGRKAPKRGVFLDFMGFRFYRGRTTLRESIFYRMCRKSRRLDVEKPPIYNIRQFLSYLGWLKSTDTYRAYEAYVKPNVNVQYLKRRVSRHDKRERRKNDAEMVQIAVNGQAA